ncbi:unnamed protein product [Fusarium equiseti]|uniref:Rho-GAP domain-containing protein n=1 Tax=Fusarium equiseti TaxID=61235 RepID=A0A8J2N8L7_FUSEQ|nr:unnamed protein product [Fusarium equiseti]
MGRKAAPQPLALSSQSQSSAQSQTQTQVQAQSDSDAALRNKDSPLTAETVSPAVSPVESKSPRSPRSSPFHSRFSPLRNQGSKQKQTKSSHTTAALTTVTSQGEPSLSSSAPAPATTQRPSTSAATTGWSNREEPTSRPPLRHTREDPSTYPSISSTLEERFPDPPASAGTHSPSEVRQQTSGEPKKSSKNGFFHFNKQSKSSSQFQPHAHYRKKTETRAQVMSRGSDGSNQTRHREKSDPTYPEHTLHKPTSADPLRSDLSVSSAGDYEAASPQSSTRKGRSKPFGILNRSRSNRDKEDASPELKPVTSPRQGNEPELHLNSVPYRAGNQANDRSIRDMMNSAVRNRSEDRAPRDTSSTRKAQRDKEPKTQPSSLNENGGSFFNGLKSSGTRAAGMLSDRFFKGGRGGREDKEALDDEHYQLKVINLPLVEQTRLTRISKRLEDSRDKTEFWMPAFPWRAIDYLNYKGCEVEGLYRVPGSGPQIKKWQRKFDEQYDVNLFNERDLYDINIIGSMLKAWLRELPDELFPKAAQDRISKECAGSEEVPELLVEELSNLSPFNYYLLFAITCHLSLLLAHSDKNKMDFRNLCICFQPCMKIDAFCFKFLVCDWRDCWRGCKNEAKYIEEEYVIFDQPPPRGLAEPAKPRPQEESEDDRQQLSSSGSSKKSDRHSPGNQNSKLKKKQLQISPSSGSVTSTNSSAPATLNTNNDHDVQRPSTDIRPLSPIMPLSPLGF